MSKSRLLKQGLAFLLSLSMSIGPCAPSFEVLAAETGAAEAAEEESNVSGIVIESMRTEAATPSESGKANENSGKTDTSGSEASPSDALYDEDGFLLDGVIFDDNRKEAQSPSEPDILPDEVLLPGSLLMVADETAAFGSCGENLRWYILERDEGYELKITGTGGMYDYAGGNEVPWNDYATRLCALTIDEGVTRIGVNAFYEDSGISGELNLPESLEEIGWAAFYGCSGFTGELKLPGNLEKIGGYAFCSCSGFTGSLVLPDSLTELGKYAFSDCSGFDGSLKLSAQLEEIQENSFSGCTGFTGGLMIPENVKNIGKRAFEECSGFSGELYLPHGVEVIGEEAFSECSGLSGSLILPDKLTIVSKYAFLKCSSFNELVIPEGITLIEEGAFQFCSGFKGSLILPEGLQRVERLAFYGCNGFDWCITYPESLEYLGEMALEYFSEYNGEKLKFTRTAFLGAEPTADYVVFGSVLYYPDDEGGWTEEKRAGISELSSWKAYPRGSKPWLNDFDELAAGLCGDNITWSVTKDLENGIALNVQGSGSMYDFDRTEVPWVSYKNQIVKLNLDGEITRIGAEAFRGLRNAQGALVLPETLKEIGEYAFSDSCFTGDLALPDSVTEIERNAFSFCRFQGKLVLPKNLVRIGNYAFYGANFAGPLLLPEKIVEIGEGAFKECKGFEGTLLLPEGLCKIGYDAFENCAGFTGDLTLPSTITYMGRGCFSGCSGLTGTLYIPGNLPEAPYNPFAEDNSHGSGFSVILYKGNEILAFGSCGSDLRWTVKMDGPDMVLHISGTGPMTGHYNPSLRSDQYWWGLDGEITRLEMEEGLTEIGRFGFSSLSTNLRGELRIPETVRVIHEGAFALCAGLTGTLQFPKELEEIGRIAFAGCSGFTGTLNIPGNVETIEYAAFRGCSGIQGLVLPSGLSELEEDAFSGCSGISGELLIPGTVKTIGTGAFASCEALNGNLVLQEGLVTIKDSAFSGCSGLSGKLSLPSTLEAIGCGSFYGCGGLRGDLKIPDHVTKLGSGAFHGCSGFDGELHISEGLSEIPSATFYGCSGLTGNLVVPGNIKEIARGAFTNCRGFTGDLVLEEGVEVIDDCIVAGAGAFENCDGFQGDLKLPETLCRIGSAAFKQCEGFSGTLALPQGLEYVGEEAFAGCVGFGGGLTIPRFLGNIGYRAFNGILFSSVTFQAGALDTDEHSGQLEDYGGVIYYPADENSWTEEVKNAVAPRAEWIPASEAAVIQPVEHIDLDQYVCTVSKGESFKLTATIEPENASNKNVFWSSSDVSVAEVDQNGVVTAVGRGEAVITVKTENGDRKQCCEVTVTENYIPVEGVILNRSEAQLYEGESFHLEATVIPESATNKTLKWSSSNENVAEIDQNGTISAKCRGTAIITVNAEDGEKQSVCSVVVLQYIDKGQCGESLIWSIKKLNENYILTISGTGKMNDYSSESAPWESYKDVISKVILEEGITSIGEDAFRGFNSVQGELSFPNSLQEIGACAFEGCKGLTGDLIIPDSVRIIGDSAFANCSGLDGELKLPAQLEGIEHGVFAFCFGLTGQLVLPKNIVYIGEQAFCQCKNFQGDIIIPATVKEIGKEAFHGLNNVYGNLIIEGNIDKVGKMAFYPSSFQTVYFLGSSPKEYAGDSFEIPVYYYPADDPAWTEAVRDSIDNTYAEWIPYRTGETPWIFESVVLGEGKCGDDIKWELRTEKNRMVSLKITGSGAIYDYDYCGGPWMQYFTEDNMSSIKELYISEGITSIGNGAFGAYGDVNLLCVENSLIMPQSLTKIGQDNFSSWIMHKKIVLPEHLESIGNYAFNNGYFYEGIEIPESVSEIGDYAFSYAVIYRNITTEKRPEFVGDHAFYKAQFVDEEIAVNKVIISDSLVEMEPGETCQLSAYVDPFYAPERKLVWSTSDETVATVDQNGLVRALKPGTAMITVAAEVNGVSAYCTVSILSENVPTTGITVSESEKTMTIGEEFTLTASVLPADATNKRLTWHSSDSSIATVNQAGKITGKKAGIAEITAASEDGGFKAVCRVTVIQRVTGVTLSRTTNEVTEGDSFTLTANVVPADATNKKVAWSSSDTKVATVDQNGKVIAVKAGIARITVKTEDGAKSSYCNVSVKAKDLKNAFIQRLYRTCLNREADAGGLNYWLGQVNSGNLKGIALAGKFVFSGEFTGKNYCDEHFVRQLYVALMDRQADAGGLSYWTGRLANGEPRERIMNDFTSSAEYRKMCSEAGIALGARINEPKYGTKPYGACAVCGEKTKVVQFVERMYKECMGRGADAGGLKYWSKALYEHTKTGRDLTRGFVLSAEMRNKNLSNSEYIQAIYRVMLGRESDKGGLAFWEGQMKKGKTLADIIEGFVNSREFTNICNDYGIQRK